MVNPYRFLYYNQAAWAWCTLYKIPKKFKDSKHSLDELLGRKRIDLTVWKEVKVAINKFVRYHEHDPFVIGDIRRHWYKMLKILVQDQHISNYLKNFTELVSRKYLQDR